MSFAAAIKRHEPSSSSSKFFIIRSFQIPWSFECRGGKKALSHPSFWISLCILYVMWAINESNVELNRPYLFKRPSVECHSWYQWSKAVPSYITWNVCWVWPMKGSTNLHHASCSSPSFIDPFVEFVWWHWFIFMLVLDDCSFEFRLEIVIEGIVFPTTRFFRA